MGHKIIVSILFCLIISGVKAQDKIKRDSQKTIVKTEINKSFSNKESSILEEFKGKQTQMIGDMYNASAAILFSSPKLNGETVSVKITPYKEEENTIKPTIKIID